MTKTAPRVRNLNLYTVEQDGKPVAQAMAISQADAVRLYVESVQQPTMSARLSTPLEARTLAGLPLLQREPAEVDTRTADLLGDAPDAPVAAPAVCDPVQVEASSKSADHVEGILAMVPPQHAPIEAVTEGLASGLPAEFVSYIEGEEPAAAPLGEPAEPVAPDASAQAGAEPGSSASGADDAPAADAPMHAERMTSAYAVGVEIARQGHTRWSAEFLDANAAALSGLRGAAADEVHAEMLRGLEDGQPIPARKPELKQQAEEAAARAGGKIVAKYRDPATGQTWSGRGLKPRWLVAAIEEGRAQDEFLIDAQGEQA